MREVLQFLIDRGGLSQDELARLLGVNKSTVSRWMKGIRDIHPALEPELWELARIVSTALASQRDVREALQGWAPNVTFGRDGNVKIGPVTLPRAYANIVRKISKAGNLAEYERFLLARIKAHVAACEDATSLRVNGVALLIVLGFYNEAVARAQMENLKK
jgi:hypothetical protein